MSAQAQVIFTRTGGGSGPAGNLFAGKKFWLSKALPQRNYICEQLESNGGQIVVSENDADVKIVDHKKRHPPPGTYSFMYILDSVRNGQLQDLDKYIAGPAQGTVREAASARPTKGTRTPFTAADDKVLYDWVKKQERKGKPILGNQIYKELERVNPRHTFQSWRDRWVKHLQHRPDPQAGFTQDEFEYLMATAADILDVDTDRLDEAWEKFTQHHPEHTAIEWRKYFEETVLPEYRKMNRSNENQATATGVQSPSRSSPKGRREADQAPSNVQARSKSPLFVPRSQNSTPSAQAPPDAQSEPEDSLPSNPHAQLESIEPTDFPRERRERSVVQDSYRPVKRQTEVVDSDDTSKQSLDDVQPPSAKRRPVGSRVSRLAEIPSTPEKSGGTWHADSPQAMQPNLTSHEDEEVSLGEDDAINVNGHAPSESLTEPGRADDMDVEVKVKGESIPNFLDFNVPAPEGGWTQYGLDDQFPFAVLDGNVEALSQPNVFSETLSGPPVKNENDNIPRSSPPVLTPRRIYPNPFPPDSDTDEPDANSSSLLPPLSSLLEARKSAPAPQQAPRSSPDSSEEPQHEAEPEPEPRKEEPDKPANKEEGSAEALDEWIDAHIREGYDEEHVILALRHATMDPELAETILEHNGKSHASSSGSKAATTPTSTPARSAIMFKLPEGVPGIWTAQDDDELESGDPSRTMAMDIKHGTRACSERWIFLQSYRAGNTTSTSVANSVAGGSPGKTG